MVRLFFPANEFYPTVLGGSARTIKQLTRLPFQIEVYTGLKGIKQPAHFAGKRASLNNANISYGFSEGMTWRDVGGVISALRKCDIIYCNSIFSRFSIFSIIANLFLRKRLILSPRGELFPNALSSRNRIAKRTLLFCLKPLIRRGIVSSKDEEKQFLDFFPLASVDIIANPVSTSPKPNRNVRNYKILFLGRIAPIKNLESLLCHNYRDLGYQLHVYGPVEKQFQNYFDSLTFDNSKGCFYGGVLSDDEKWSAIQSSDFLVLPSHSENFGNVVVEAMSQGTPVIISEGVPFDGSVAGVHQINFDSTQFLDILSNTSHNNWILESAKVRDYFEGSFAIKAILKHYSAFFNEID
jgi:glycosyltransferase involved in cell wall biosynthesis